MTEFEAQNADFEAVVRDSFKKQQIMAEMGAELISVEPGRTEIGMPFNDRLTQQDGFLHAGAITTLADSACGYAALSLMPAGSSVLAVEFKINFLSPVKGESVMAVGEVIKAGNTITVCRGQVYSREKGESKLAAQMQATMIRVEKG